MLYFLVQLKMVHIAYSFKVNKYSLYSISHIFFIHYLGSSQNENNLYFLYKYTCGRFKEKVYYFIFIELFNKFFMHIEVFLFNFVNSTCMKKAFEIN